MKARAELSAARGGVAWEAFATEPASQDRGRGCESELEGA